jgi:hypothetical protein
MKVSVWEDSSLLNLPGRYRSPLTVASKNISPIFQTVANKLKLRMDSLARSRRSGLMHHPANQRQHHAVAAVLAASRWHVIILSGEGGLSVERATH